MKKILIILVCVQAMNAFAQVNSEKDVKSEIKKVTVFFKNAQITRNASVTIKSGKTNLKFVNLSPFIHSKSVQVKVNGKVTVLSVNHQQNYLDSIAKPKELTGLESRYKSIQSKINVE